MKEVKEMVSALLHAEGTIDQRMKRYYITYDIVCVASVLVLV